MYVMLKSCFEFFERLPGLQHALFGGTERDFVPLYLPLIFVFQISMNVRTLMPAARSASTTKEIISVNAMKAMRWTLSLRPAKLWVSHLYTHAHTHKLAPVFIHTVLLVMDVPTEKYSWPQMYFKKNHTGQFLHTHQHIIFLFQLPFGYWVLTL